MTDPGPIDLASHHIALARGDMRTAGLTEYASVGTESRSAALANAAIAQALSLARIEQHLALIAESLGYPVRTVTEGLTGEAVDV